MSTWQPFYAAFVKNTGGGTNVEYIIWINRKWAAFEAERPGAISRVMRLEEFAEWLCSNATDTKDSTAISTS